MYKPRKPNHLAKQIDHQRSAASALPDTLISKITLLRDLTQEIKQILGNGLPKEILKSLWVVKYEAGYLVLSVHSQTAANHLRYQANNLLTILKEQSLTFSQLKNIDVIVTYSASIDHLNDNEQTLNSSFKQSSSTENRGVSHKTQGLTETTRRTIAYTARHVITDERLKKSLERLIKP